VFRNPLQALFAVPLLRRIGFHARRIGGGMDRHFFTSLLSAVIGFVLVAAIAVTLLEDDKRTLAGFGKSFYWAVTTVIGSGDASFVTSPGGYIIGWLLAFFGVAIVAAMTGAVVGFVIDILLKEGQGMGAAGFTEHIVVCGWNATARDLIEELKGDEFTSKVVLLHDSDRSPPGTASTSCAATSRTPTTSSGPGSARRPRRSSSPPTARTRPTCARSWQ
jgi:voltage-gated potassium channel